MGMKAVVCDCMTALQPVVAGKPLAPWTGGKRLLAKRLIARINDVPHMTYAEPFVGIGGVFLRRNMRPKSEVINDINSDIINMFRVAQRHPEAFIVAMGQQIASREELQRLRRVDPETLTDIERAVRFLYLQRLAFGGRVDGAMGIGFARVGGWHINRLYPENLRDTINALHKRLGSVVLERLPWDDFIRRYDREKTLFYLDPPYFGHEGDYGKGLFGRGNFAAMADVLRGLRGRFILSLNDRPEVREIFAGFDMEEVGVTYFQGAGCGATKEAREVIISN